MTSRRSRAVHRHRNAPVLYCIVIHADWPGLAQKQMPKPSHARLPSTLTAPSTLITPPPAKNDARTKPIVAFNTAVHYEYTLDSMLSSCKYYYCYEYAYDYHYHHNYYLCYC